MEYRRAKIWRAYNGRLDTEFGKTVFLASCVKKKASFPLPADELYESEWFCKVRTYIVNRKADRDRWYILSAKYGLVAPSQMIGPYEQTLNDMSKQERRRWADHVYVELGKVLSEGDRVVMLAGQRYREFLEPPLRSMGYEVHVPMQGLSIG